MDNLIGKTLGNYKIHEKIGEGGMAQVFKAFQPGLERWVAVKVLSPILGLDQNFANRFQREARSIAKLQHPNIVQVYDYGAQDNYSYIVMRYVEDSITLTKLIKGSAPVDKLIDYIIQVADALDYAHKRGMIHRDVKPGNILIDDRWALLADFGLVRIGESASDLTRTGVGIGTPAYMSPEQGFGSQVDHRTDIYSLGVILYQILTGKIPHDASTPQAILMRRNIEPAPPSLRQINPNVSEALEQISMCALAKNPDDRYNSAMEFAEALKQAKQDSIYKQKLATASPDVKSPPLITQISSNKPLASVEPNKVLKKKSLVRLISGGVIAAGLIIGGVFYLYQSPPANDDPVVATSVEEIVNLNTPESFSTPVSPTLMPTPTPTSPESTPDDVATVTIVATTTPAEKPVETSSSTATAITVTPTRTGTPTATSSPTSIPTPTATSTSQTTSVVPRATAIPTAPPVSQGQLVLLKPNPDTQVFSNNVEFQWQWNASLEEDQGFEVRVWREGEFPRGVHNAVLDNQQGIVKNLGNNIYSLTVDITDTEVVKSKGGDYFWTVLLVKISPEYRELGIQADPPGRMNLAIPGPGGGGGGSSGGGGSGGSFH